jgi:hypothetical protein
LAKARFGVSLHFAKISLHFLNLQGETGSPWTGVLSQEGRMPVVPGRQDNLMAPVHGLHRTRGRFGAGARGRAPVIPGRSARLLPLVCGALFGFLAGRLRGTQGLR